MCFVPQQRALFAHLNCQRCSRPEAVCTFLLRNVLRATTARTFSTSQLPKIVGTWCVFSISTSKMCFAPQQRALFAHLKCQRCSRPEAVCTFLLRHVLRATTARTFSTSQLPKIVGTWCVFSISTSKMCFAPQQRALFAHLKCQRCSRPEAVCTFLLRNVLPATTACTFSTSQLPKLLWT